MKDQLEQNLQKVRNAKRILIVGDSGRGKTTFAKKLSKKLDIKYHSTDDFFWKIKFTVMRDKKISTKKITKLYQQKEWIVEGSTRHLIAIGIEKADLLIYFGYKNILLQFGALFKRYLKRDEEKLVNLLGFCKHLFLKRYKLGKQKGKISVYELISNYKPKTIELHSFKEINELIDKA